MLTTQTSLVGGYSWGLSYYYSGAADGYWSASFGCSLGSSTLSSKYWSSSSC